MCITNGKWVVSLLQSLDFIKAMIRSTHQGQFLGLAPKDLQQFKTCPKGHDNLVICII
jgi:hypothetical protein